MPIFQIKQNQLLTIKEKKVDLEKDLQKITENNLEIVFGLKFISSEFALENFRIDTLAFDEETKSFVIIEYKRDRSRSVIDQGFTYLSLLLNKKDSFILEYARKTKLDLESIKIDWSQSRVLFLANAFTTYQQNAINFKDLPIELWEVKKYDNQTILYNRLKAADSKESIKTISQNEIVRKVSREVKRNTIDDHFKKGWEDSREIFEVLKEQILNIDNRIIENPNPKGYIGYKIANSNLCAISVYKSKLSLDLVRVDKENLKDPENKVKKIPWRKYKWPKLCSYEIKNVDDIQYGLFLIRQVYNKFYK